jgi:hypothetical protein
MVRRAFPGKSESPKARSGARLFPHDLRAAPRSTSRSHPWVSTFSHTPPGPRRSPSATTSSRRRTHHAFHRFDHVLADDAGLHRDLGRLKERAVTGALHHVQVALLLGRPEGVRAGAPIPDVPPQPARLVRWRGPRSAQRRRCVPCSRLCRVEHRDTGRLAPTSRTHPIFKRPNWRRTCSANASRSMPL